MELQETSSAKEIALRMKEVLEEVIATGDWEHSIFLQATGTALRKLITELAEFIAIEEQKQERGDSSSGGAGLTVVPPGYTQVFILLYQVAGDDLGQWFRTIKNLGEFSSTRPAYKEKSLVQAALRAKESGLEHNGYVVVNIKNEDFYGPEQVAQDALGQQMFALKEHAVKAENIVEFVHAEKNRYRLGTEQLILLGKVTEE